MNAVQTNNRHHLGRATSMTYLPTRRLNSVSRVLDGQSVGITYEYDQQMNSLCIRDALNRAVESYVLDTQDRPVSISNIEGQVMSITYGVGDYVKQVTRFDGTVVNNSFNSDGLISSVQYPGSTNNLTYYKNGLLKTIADETSSISNEFNLANRLIFSVSQISSFQSQISYGYYPAGQVSAVTSIVGSIHYTLDAGDRLSSIASPAGTFSYSYSANNGMITGVSCSAVGISAAYAFDTLDRVTNIVWKDVSSTVLRSFAYAFNNTGLTTQKVSMINGQPNTNGYSYDNLDRLISETSVGSATSAVQYSYDLVGNRTQMVQNGETISYTLGQGNKLSSWGTNGENTISYNTAGCVTQICISGDSTKALTWDSRYQVAEVRTNGIIAETYQYDALGRRISISDGSTTNYLVYDGIHVIAETDASGILLKSYTYGPGIDNILSMTVYGGTTQTYYYVKDHLGSVLALTDSSGTIVESYQYDAWGNTSVFDGSGNPLAQSSIGNRYCWQGREISWKTGLYYFRARWYDPVTGRWLSNDPIGISGGLNQYVFCGDNPVNLRDPFGLCSEADTRMQQIRTFIDAADIAAGRSLWAPKWFVETLGAIALHGGPWSPLDLMANTPGQTWNVNGQTMTSPQFGNYLAGYYAGYAGSQGILAGMYAGGIIYAAGGNIAAGAMGQSYGESMTDAQSVPFISSGFIAGSQARRCPQ